MATCMQVHTVCPYCKRPVMAEVGESRAECTEHGLIVPMRSAIVNAPLPSPKPPAPATVASHTIAVAGGLI